MMSSNFITVRTPFDDKIHYVSVTDGIPNSITECGIDGPFNEVIIQYRDRYEDKVCKRCFKSYIMTLSM